MNNVVFVSSSAVAGIAVCILLMLPFTFFVPMSTLVVGGTAAVGSAVGASVGIYITTHEEPEDEEAD